MALLLSSVPAHAPAQTDRLVARAEAAASAGRWPRARRLYRRALREDPRDPRAALALAEHLPDALDPGVAEEAAEVLGALDALSPSFLDVDTARAVERHRAWVATLVAHAGNDDEGLDAAVDRLAARVGVQDGAGAAMLRRLAAVALRDGDRRRARGALVAAARAMPQARETAIDLALLELSDGAPQAAIDRLERALLRYPDDAEIRRDLAGALLAAGRPAEALGLYRALRAANPDRGALALEHGRVALAAGELAEAQRAAEDAEAQLPAAPEPPTLRGLVAAAAGRVEDAEAAFREALRRDPAHGPASRGLQALGVPPVDVEAR
jgi:tetratricopeptide (TPR) repeat protein